MMFSGRPMGRPMGRPSPQKWSPFPPKSCEKVRFAGGIFAFFFNFSRILTHKLQQYPKFPQQIDILYAFLWGIARSAMPGSAHPKRSRYYSAVLDVKNLKRGDKYNSLRPSYIIFICQFDYFNQGEAVCVFERADLKKSLPMGDESYTIVVNTKSKKEVPESLRSLFDYINKGEVDTSDSFISQIHEEVMALQESEEVANIMTMEEEYERRNTAAFDRGMAAGLEQGMAAAIKKLALSMKANGRPLIQIAQDTGLSVVEIEAL